MAELLKLEHIRKSYGSLEILHDVSIEVEEGELVAITGPSGCGKSTLLHITGLLDAADAGEITLAGHDYSNASDTARTKARIQDVGFIYQQHHLIPELTALENVILPQMIAKADGSAAETRAKELLEQVGLAERLEHRPFELSGGEQQRVAIARALANKPKLLLADEPTGNLDPETSEQVFSLLLKTIESEGSAALIATHNMDLAKRMHRHIFMEAVNKSV